MIAKYDEVKKDLSDFVLENNIPKMFYIIRFVF